MTVKTEERHAQLELCIPYVFGRLNPGNRKQFEAHLAGGCEQCRIELSGLYESTALLPLLLRQETPPSALRQGILDRLSVTRPEPAQNEHSQPVRNERGQQRRNERPRQTRGERSQQTRNERAPQPQREKPVTPSLGRERPWYLYASIILGALLIVALVIFVNQLVDTAGSQEKQLAELKGELQRAQTAAGILQAEKLEMFTMTGVTPGSGIYGKVLLDPAKRTLVLQTANLPVSQEGKQYQLWILKEKAFYSGGVFEVTKEKSSTLNEMPLPVAGTREIEGFSITLEPKGGSPAPSGAPLLRSATK
jgi:anti-sigma-K factor RskA